MTKFEFIKEQDNIRNKVFYFTRVNGEFFGGTMHTDKDKAYDAFLKLSGQKPPIEETVLFTVLTP